MESQRCHISPCISEGLGLSRLVGARPYVQKSAVTVRTLPGPASAWHGRGPLAEESAKMACGVVHESHEFKGLGFKGLGFRVWDLEVQTGCCPP